MLSSVDAPEISIDQLEQTLINGELMSGAIRAAQAEAIRPLREIPDGGRTLAPRGGSQHRTRTSD